MWAKSFVSLLEDVFKYVKDSHTTGLVWNAKGGAAGAAKAAAAAPKPAASVAAAAAAPPAKGGLFAALFGDVTGGLKVIFYSLLYP